MKYFTSNELEHFSFSEAYIAAIQKINGYFQLTLDNVTILPDNSCNRDIREMRTNGLNLKIQDGKINLLIQEGYKVYNPDGILVKEYEDKLIEQEEYNHVLKAMEDGASCIYALKKEEYVYTFVIDASDERTYILRVTGAGDIEEWDRFLSKE